jgi:hypothetical protein
MVCKPVYESTRGGEKGLSFRHVVLKGLADDGGLFVPSHLPRVDQQQLDRWRTLPYTGLAFEILSLFIDEEDIPATKLREIIQRSYSSFFIDDVLRVEPCYMGEAREQQINVCELFHGPTFSFKDFALQFLGHVFEYLLDTNALRKQQQQQHPATGEKEDEEDPASVTRITVLGATSGTHSCCPCSMSLEHFSHRLDHFSLGLVLHLSGDTGSAGEHTSLRFFLIPAIWCAWMPIPCLCAHHLRLSASISLGRPAW